MRKKRDENPYDSFDFNQVVARAIKDVLNGPHLSQK